MHMLSEAQKSGRRLAFLINEFGDLGIDGDIVKGCGITGCEDVIELANGCICCTVADDFLPAMESVLDRPNPPDHIVIETSGLALPKPLLKAFSWPGIATRATIDGVIAVVDGPAAAEGRFKDEVEPHGTIMPGIEHDNPIAELFTDQVNCADLILLNKDDRMNEEARGRARQAVAEVAARPVQVLPASFGQLDIRVLLGMEAAAENDMAVRPSLHELDGDHDHDDFLSFAAPVPALADPAVAVDRLRDIAAQFGILRLKGFLAVSGKDMRLLVQGVGTRLASHYDRPWQQGEERTGRLVVIGEKMLDRAGILAALAQLY